MAPATKLDPRYKGPYVITSLHSDGNVAKIAGYFSGTEHDSPVHISRLVPFDTSRADSLDIADAMVEPGIYVVQDVLAHQVDSSGVLELIIRWYRNPLTTWEPAYNLRDIAQVKTYCAAQGLIINAPPPAPAPSARGGRARR